jgi:hypothetical protein
MNKFSGFATYMFLGVVLTSALRQMSWRLLIRESSSIKSPRSLEKLQQRLESCAHQLEEIVSRLYQRETGRNKRSSTSTSSPSPSAASICAIQKDGLYYIDEWVDYHLALGFQTIFLYDNSDDFELENWARSRNPSRVVVQHLPGPKQQKNAYQQCVSEQKQSQEHKWVAILDIDEFIVLKKHDTIVELLEDIVPNESAGLSLNRLAFYFSENQTAYYEPLPVTKRFPMRVEWVDRWYKTIAKVDRILRPNVHGHKYYRGNRASIDTNGRPVTDIPSSNDPTATDEVAVIHHYQTKSLQEFQSKCRRGDAVHGILLNNNTSMKGNQEACLPTNRIMEKFGESAGRRTFDDSAWKFLQGAVPNYRKYNKVLEENVVV